MIKTGWVVKPISLFNSPFFPSLTLASPSLSPRPMCYRVFLAYHSLLSSPLQTLRRFLILAFRILSFIIIPPFQFSPVPHSPSSSALSPVASSACPSSSYLQHCPSPPCPSVLSPPHPPDISGRRIAKESVELFTRPLIRFLSRVVRLSGIT